MTYYLKIALYSLLPTIGVNLVTWPFWGNNIDTNTGLATFSIILTIGLLPLYLLTINYFFAKKYKVNRFILNGLLIVACIWLSSYFHFLNWADSIGSRSNPDAGTQAVISFEQWTGTIVVVIGTFIGHLNLIKQDNTTSK